MAKIWKSEPNLKALNDISKNTLADALGIEVTDYGDDYIVAKMPVDHRTKQPMGLLHGGASAALAETLGSIAAVYCADSPDLIPVGVEINANHLRSAKEGYVYGKVSPIRIGRKIHVWGIDIHDDYDRHICTSRLTVMMITR